MTKTDLYDAVTLEIERAEILIEHIQERLAAITSRGDSPKELCAIHLMAESVSARLQTVREKAKALFDGPLSPRKARAK